MTTEACEAAILSHLATSEQIEDTFPWSISQSLDHAKVTGAIKSLLPDDYIRVEDLSTSFWSLEQEAEEILANGSQEILVLRVLIETGRLSVGDLQTKVGKNVAKIGMGNCMKNKWVVKDGGDLVPIKTMEEVSDETQASLQALKAKDYAVDAIDDKVRVDSKPTHLI